MKTPILFIFTCIPFFIAAQNINEYALRLQLKYENDLIKGKKLLKPPFLNTNFIEENGRALAFDGFGDNGFPEYKITCSNIGLAATVNANQLWPSGLLGLSLSGNGSNKLGMWDGGGVRTTHREFLGRLSIMDTSTSLLAHANNVAGV